MAWHLLHLAARTVVTWWRVVEAGMEEASPEPGALPARCHDPTPVASLSGRGRKGEGRGGMVSREGGPPSRYYAYTV